MTKEDYEILCNLMPGGKRPPDHAVKLLEDICTAHKLDWKARHAYLMERGGKWQVTISIDGFRLVGSRDPDYAGQEGPFWVTTQDGAWTDIPPDGPIYAARVGLKHLRAGSVTWGVAKFKDYAAGPMWSKFPSTMIAKCAEMLGWRKAFPGLFGGLYGVEEMAQGHKEAQAVVEGLGSGTDYAKMLSGAKTMEEVINIGTQITDDKTLTIEQLQQLHALYMKRKETV